jgi:hypothetical protein
MEKARKSYFKIKKTIGKLNIENNILLFKGVLLSSARHPSLDALQ